MHINSARPFLGWMLAASSLLLLAGCRQDMHDQPKYRGFRKSTIFADGRSVRPLVEGTVARGFLRADDGYFTGKVNGENVKEFPVKVDEDLLKRGQARFNIYCTPCHDKLGTGNGMIVRRGLRTPPSYHIDRLRNEPPGYFYDVITNGFGAMQNYAAQVPVEDRWAIVAYVRVLQRSQAATVADVPADKLSLLKQSGGKPIQ